MGATYDLNAGEPYCTDTKLNSINNPEYFLHVLRKTSFNLSKLFYQRICFKD